MADIKRLFSYLSLNLYFSVSSKYQSSLLLDFSLCCARNIYLTSRNILAILLSRLKCTPPIPSIQVSATSYFPNGKVTQKKATILSKKTKRFQNDHNKRVDYTHSHAQVASCDGPASQQPSQPYTGKFPYLNTSKSTDANAAGHATFQYVSRPLAQGAFNSNTGGTERGGTPMERWQNESIQEQPWNALEGVCFRDSENMSKAKL